LAHFALIAVWLVAGYAAFGSGFSGAGLHASAQSAEPTQGNSATKKVKVRMQARPGGPMEDLEMPVHEAPVDLPSVPADHASLKDDELVLGVVIDGQAVAYPVRYLALYEIVDHRVGRTPVAPSW
jgi:hypothetical protein